MPIREDNPLHPLRLAQLGMSEAMLEAPETKEHLIEAAVLLDHLMKPGVLPPQVHDELVMAATMHRASKSPGNVRWPGMLKTAGGRK